MGDAGAMGDGSEGSEGGVPHTGTKPGGPRPRLLTTRSYRIPKNQLESCKYVYSTGELPTQYGRPCPPPVPLFLVGRFDNSVPLTRPEILNSLAGITDHSGVRSEISSVPIAP